MSTYRLRNVSCSKWVIILDRRVYAWVLKLSDVFQCIKLWQLPLRRPELPVCFYSILITFLIAVSLPLPRLKRFKTYTNMRHFESSRIKYLTAVYPRSRVARLNPSTPSDGDGLVMSPWCRTFFSKECGFCRTVPFKTNRRDWIFCQRPRL